MVENRHALMRRAARDAEEIVRSVKEPALRKVAYERVFARLLEEAAVPPQNAERSQSRPPDPEARKRKAKSGPMAWLTDMVTEGFFKKPKTAPEILAKLRESDHHLEYSAITGQLHSLCVQHILRRVSAPRGEAKRATWVNW